MWYRKSAVSVCISTRSGDLICRWGAVICVVQGKPFRRAHNLPGGNFYVVVRNSAVE